MQIRKSVIFRFFCSNFKPTKEVFQAIQYLHLMNEVADTETTWIMQNMAEQSKGRVHVLDEMVYNDPKLMQPHFKKLLPTHKLLIKLVYRVQM